MILENVRLIDEATYSCLSHGLEEINAGGVEDWLARGYHSHLKHEEPGIIGSLYRENPNEEKFFIADLVLGENAPAYFRDRSGLNKAIQYAYGRVPGTNKRRRTMSEMGPTLNNLPVTLSSEGQVVLVAREYIHPEKSEERLIGMAFSRVPQLSSDLMRNLSVCPGEISNDYPRQYIQHFGKVGLMIVPTEFETWGPSGQFNRYAEKLGFEPIYGDNQF